MYTYLLMQYINMRWGERERENIPPCARKCKTKEQTDKNEKQVQHP